MKGEVQTSLSEIVNPFFLVLKDILFLRVLLIQSLRRFSAGYTRREIKLRSLFEI